MTDSNYAEQTIVSDEVGEKFGKEIAEEIKALTNDYTGHLQRLNALNLAKDWTRQDLKRKDEITLRIAQKLGIDAELKELRAIHKEREQRIRDAVDANTPAERIQND